MKYPDKKTAVFILTTGEGTWTERLEIVGSKGTLLLEDSHLTFICMIGIWKNIKGRLPAIPEKN